MKLKIKKFKFKILLVLIAVFCLGYSIPSYAITISKTSSFLTSGLVAWWTFDGKDMQGGAKDALGNTSNTGALYNISTSTFYKLGKFGQGLSFDGADDNVIVPHNAAINNLATFTLSTWIYPRTSGEAGFGRIVDKQAGASFLGWDLEMEGAGLGNLAFWPANGANRITNNGVVTYNQWNHVVATYGGGTAAANLHIYVNNVEATYASEGAGGSQLDESNVDLFIGNRLGLDRTFDGIIDDVKIYNRVITAAERLQLFNQGGGAKQNASPKINLTSGLASQWTFDGKDISSAGQIKDVSGNAHNGNPQSISSSTFYSLGKIGQGAKFDGVNDFVSLPGTSIYRTTGYSTSLWFKTADSSDSMALYVDTTAGGSAPLFAILTDGFGYLSITLYNDAGANVGTAETDIPYSAFGDNKWHHMVITDSGGAAVKFYIDGVADTASGSYTPSGTFTFTESGIGAIKQFGSIFSNWNGSLDDVRTYTRVLSAAEVKQLYNQGGGTKQNATPRNPLTSGLLGWWTFDGRDIPAGRINDVSGNGKHGSPTNIATSTFYALGKIGQGLNFDGVNDYVAVGNVSSSVKSVAFWMKTTNTTKKILDLNGSATIETSSGTITANSFTSPTIYVNGAATSTITANTWYHVVVTTGTAVNASAVDLGRIASGYFPGVLDDVRMYDRALSTSEVIQLYNVGR